MPTHEIRLSKTEMKELAQYALKTQQTDDQAAAKLFWERMEQLRLEHERGKQ